MQPITMKDVADFLQLVISAFEQPLFFAFTAMLAGVVAYNVKRLFLD